MTVLFCQQTLSCTKITKRMCKRTREPRLFKAVNKESNTERTNIEELRWTYNKHGTTESSEKRGKMRWPCSYIVQTKQYNGKTFSPVVCFLFPPSLFCLLKEEMGLNRSRIQTLDAEKMKMLVDEQCNETLKILILENLRNTIIDIVSKGVRGEIRVIGRK